MKKLNKKGFTLIELLAVIVVLAIVLVITIPAVLTSLDKSKTQAFQASANSIASWFESQTGYCKLGTAGVTNSGYNSTLLSSFFDANCTHTTASDISEEILKAAGGSASDYTASVEVDANGRACVTLTAKSGGKFTGTAESSGC